MWAVDRTPEFDEWWDTLDQQRQEALTVRVAYLSRVGPQARRPVVGEIKGSRFDPRMKEIICEERGSLRALFIFDPRRHAVLLLGGNKTGQWKRWYRQAIPEADRLYQRHLDELDD